MKGRAPRVVALAVLSASAGLYGCSRPGRMAVAFMFGRQTSVSRETAEDQE